jgi:hypothetical protein
VSLALAALLALQTSEISGEQARDSSATSSTRLLVMISVDQLVPEQLDRLAPWLTGGLARFVREGRVFPRAELRHGDTETGPGHAAYGTGRLPRNNGIVSNDWFARDGRGSVYCFADPDARALTDRGVLDEAATSPRNLRCEGIAELLDAARPGSLSFAVSSKDRSAIGMSGKRADLALWWDKKRGGFRSSTWYGAELPEWVRVHNSDWQERLPFADGWKCELPERFEGSGTAPDEREGEVGRAGQRSFPHPVPPRGANLDDKALATLAQWVYEGAASDVMVCDMARAAVEVLPLGRDEVPDLLCVSLSACDTVGHAYGPGSVEVTDVILRADRELGRLFAQLDERVGSGHWVASLSSDHGVLELPETLAPLGYPARRITGREIADTFKDARNAVAAKFGKDFFATGNYRGLRLDGAALAADGIDARAVREVYASELLARGTSWMEHAVTWDELRAVAREGASPRSGLIAMEANSFDEERTSDVVTLQKAFTLPGVAAGTAHGTPHSYDRRIPLAFLGPGIAPGRDWRDASSIDALPTLFTLAGVPVPAGLDGRSLLER